MKERIEWIDTLKGFGIIFVIIIHSTGNQLVHSLLFSVAVPIFVFVSGLLFDRHKYAGWTEFFFKHLKTRMLPYTFWVMISYVLTMVEYGRSTGAYITYLAKLTQFDFFTGFFAADFDWLSGTINNGPLWFLPCLFLIENVFYAVAQLTSTIQIGILLMAFSLSTHLIYSNMTWHMPFILNMVMTNFLFFGFGFIFKEYRAKRSLLDNKGFAILFWILISLLFIGGNISLKAGDFSTLWRIYFQYLITFSGIIVFALVAKYIESMTWLRYLGSNTLIILVLNEPLRRASCDIFALISYSFFDYLFHFNREFYTFLQVLVVLILAMPCIYIINHRLPFLIGKFSSAPERTS